ncbi:DUF2789 domain-containing protein [Photobacterium leiognathi]|uniref:DUF2789 domain-containing protein n=1 Tax=Photobacterium leiognathi TaxID=553611 RepID=UPI002736F9F9|nr:DUF2789 domain-containing protein [Photobacterium leiognathi]
MEPFQHNLSNLFSQLGLNNSDEFIQVFITKHQLSQQQHITEAPFFSKVQRRFIQECQEQDADWCEVIDQLDALLRK